MAQTQAIKRRIRSVQNAGQITKALEVVAASRMRRIQDSVDKVRSYAGLADEIMRRIAPSQEAQNHAYFKPGTGKIKLYIIFNSDRGQAGAFNSNIFNLAHRSFIQDRADGFEPVAIIFGRKGTSHFARLKEIELVGAYEDVADSPDVNVFAPVTETIRSFMDQNRLSSVQMIHTEFISSLSQTVRQSQLLPVTLEPDKEAEQKNEPQHKVHEFEPDFEAVLQESIKLYFDAKLMQARVESAVSEHAMRMVAMGNAHRNASDLADNLVLELNTMRQAAITQEIAEITGGSEALAV